MRSLYWKIFLSFWFTIILIIFSTAWVTSQITQRSALPEREQMFMDSYANAAVATIESGKKSALLGWLDKIGVSRHMALYLLSSTGEIIGKEKPPEEVKQVALNLINDKLGEGIFKSGKLLVSHEIISTSGVYYRLAAISDKPIHHYFQIPWTGLSLLVLFATFISGLICYFLSIYLTKPLRSLGMAAKSIATGKLSTRVGHFKGHNKDEIAELTDEFDRMAEQLETLINSKERLLQDISHELRSPLARIHIAIELARNKSQGLAENELARMELETSRLNALIGEILDFARLEKSTADLKLHPVNIKQLLQSVIDDANYECSENQPRVCLEAEEACVLDIDERLIRRAVENILRNALHYSSVEQLITVALSRNSSDSVQITIKDQGPGVPEDQLNKIFSPFYRVDTSRAKKTGGYGLGLAIAARAIQLHQGSIVAFNNKEGGLIVQILLNTPLNRSHYGSK